MKRTRSVRIAVSREFRNLLVEEYSRAFEDERYARLLQELLFPRWRDDLTRHPVLSQEILAELSGQEALLARNHFGGKARLDEFKANTGVPVGTEEPNWLLGRARTAWLDLPGRLQNALSIELLWQEEREMVEFVTGRPMTPRQRAQQRSERRSARRLYDPGDSPNAAYIRRLNHTPPHLFKRFERFLDQAADVADTIEKEERRHRNLLTLHVLREIGLDPTYRAVERTPRIYTIGQSTSGLSANVRAVLLGGAVHFDLTAAQLAILAKLWKLPLIEEMLQEAMLLSQPAWPLLLSAVGLEVTDKGNFKRLIYSTAYGMGEARLRREAKEWFGKDRVQRVFETPLMRELLKGREARRRRLRREGGIVDAFGQPVRLAEREGRKGKSPESSLLAHEAQSYELLVMRPALELAARTEECRIALWLHDGLYAVVTQPERQSGYVNRLVRQVNVQARRQGFATWLETEEL